uniref:Uncharacterized protein n=1 Tax=Acrobeloides nanus TaxID=290746 RepID=A0A914DZL8_9BILA
MPSPPGCPKSIAFRSGEFGGQSPLARCGLMSTEMWSGQFSAISAWVASALCAGAPSCKNVQIWSPKCLRTHGKTFDRNMQKSCKNAKNGNMDRTFAAPCKGLIISQSAER